MLNRKLHAVVIALTILGTARGDDIDRPITAAERRHWAFQPPKRPSVPAPKTSKWSRNPIDAFVLASLEANGLTPAPEADRPTLLRRLSFDLTGLPPTPVELNAYLNDRSPDAYERVVERLLNSPRYGERWAQDWLDLARYADTDGYEYDAVRPDAWRYRDWVVNALNDDLPYDRFVQFQLAGDETSPRAYEATGFNRCYPDMVDLNDQKLRRQNALNDITETTALVFLGLTLGCARCHDHKFDPLLQSDFYRLQAFFTPARFRDDLPIEDQAATARNRRASEPKSSQARGIDEAGPIAPPTFFLRRGELSQPGPEVLPAFPAVLRVNLKRPEAAIVASSRSTGRRKALADWIVSPANPLTARVIVNRLWQHHFGRGIVATPSDFGTAGAEPSHPELLDWLASELIQGSWSLKSLHRLMVESATYRQSSRPTQEALTIDPENELFSRARRRRLDGEALRDALLAVSGTLSATLGGQPIFPSLPDELSGLTGIRAIWPVSREVEQRSRRSLYVFARRNLRYPFFEAFDRPDSNASCPKRSTTTTAPQALTLLNSLQARDAAQALALRLEREAGADREGQVRLVFRLALSRDPVTEEMALGREFLARDPCLAHFCLAVLNTNEFLYID